MADSVVVDLAQSNKYWNYGINEGAALNELLTDHQKFVDTYSDLVSRVVAIFGGLDPRDLELYATLHYAYRYEMAGTRTPTKDSVIARFKHYKGLKFTQEQLEAAYAAMASAQLVKGPTIS
jgi:hypothetical protein